MDELERANARITELEARVTTLTASLAAVTGERDTARTELSTAATARRNERITTLFGADHGLADAEIEAYRGMTDAQFAAVETRIAATRQGGNPALFQQQATQGRDQQGPAPATFKAPSGYSVDEAQAQLHAKAVKYQADHPNTEYSAAVLAVAV